MYLLFLMCPFYNYATHCAAASATCSSPWFNGRNGSGKLAKRKSVVQQKLLHRSPYIPSHPHTIPYHTIPSNISLAIPIYLRLSLLPGGITWDVGSKETE